ncbi:MAG: hypothetical protein OEV40_14800 [Acidimicrobiia bacterium]|nr:hypothetical protein [Acidimicrobiia bacterium]
MSVSQIHAVEGNDLLVVVPGILGSVLADDEGPVWDFSARSLRRTLRNLSQQQLTLDDDGERAPRDGIEARALIGEVHVVPGFWTVDVYSTLLNRLAQRFGRRLGQGLVAFAYDWRLSNRYNATLLADVVDKELKAWRKAGQPEAMVQLICHSMGGLVARWFVDKLGGDAVTRRLVTIGTPHRGAFDAALALVNGYRFGPLPIELDATLASLTSVYQLLPTYPCLGEEGAEQRIEDIGLPDVDPDRVLAGLEFHRELRAPIDELIARGRDPLYSLCAIAGKSQSTAVAAIVDGDRLVPRSTIGHRSHGGDGRVPSFAALPAEWGNDALARWVPGKHAALQNGDATLAQLLPSLEPSMDLPALRTETEALALDLPAVVTSDQPVEVVVRHHDLQRDLHVEVVDLERNVRRGSLGIPRHGDGYRVELDLPGGTYQITVSDQADEPLDHVSDVVLVWD